MTVRPDRRKRWLADADPDHESISAMFGGWDRPTRGERSTSGQRARLWSRPGALLATTEQLCWYR